MPNHDQSGQGWGALSPFLGAKTLFFLEGGPCGCVHQELADRGGTMNKVRTGGISTPARPCVFVWIASPLAPLLSLAARLVMPKHWKTAGVNFSGGQGTQVIKPADVFHQERAAPTRRWRGGGWRMGGRGGGSDTTHHS